MRMDDALDPLDIIQQALYAAEWHEGRWCETQLLPDDWATRPIIERVAVVYHDQDAYRTFVKHVSEVEGWERTHDLVEHVDGHLSEECFDARREFLRDPDNEAFCIEAMLLGPTWMSQIHTALMRAHGQGTVAACFYKPHVVNKAGDRIMATGLDAYQHENTYTSSFYEVRECFAAEHSWYTYFAPRDADDMMQGYLAVQWEKP